MVDYADENNINEEPLNFQNLGKIEINFVEMIRQKSRIEELGNNAVERITRLSNAINALARDVGYTVDNPSIAMSYIQMQIKLNNITNNMDNQIKKYTELNEEIKSKIKILGGLIEEVINGNSLVLYGENGQVSEMTYQQMVKMANLSYTPTEQYDMSNLRNFVSAYEGTTNVKYIDGVKYYQKQWDVNGWAAGPGVHLEWVGEYTSPDPNYVPADVVDAAAENLLANIRTDIETSIQNNEAYSNLELTDSQIDSLTSLLYNTGKQPEYFLDRYVNAEANGTTLYDYSTQYWVNAGGVRYNGLVTRRAGEHVLAEYGYDAWVEWNAAHPLGSNTYDLGLDNLG